MNGSPLYETSKYLLSVLTIEKLLQVPVIIRFLKNIIGVHESRATHMLSAAQDTYCGEIYWSKRMICHINIIFTIKLHVA